MITWIFRKMAGLLNSRIVQNFISDLSSLRRAFCWIFLVMFMGITVYIMMINPAAHNTIIITWGSLVGAIFSGYVLSSSAERIVSSITSPDPEPQFPPEHVEDVPK